MGNIKSNSADKENLLVQRAHQLGIFYLERTPLEIDKKVLGLIPEEVARKYQIAAFKKKGKLVKVAMADPRNVDALNALRFLSETAKLEIEMYLAGEETLAEILGKYASTEKAVEDVVKSLAEEVGEIPIRSRVKEEKIVEVIQDAPVSKLVQTIINHAVDGKASDVHIEPMDNDYRVRFRLDGILHSSLTLPKEVGKVVVSRIKILSNLKIDEKRKPQDGRFKIEEGGRVIDFRVSTLPVIEGEKVVIRVLDREEGVLNFSTLGLIGRNAEILRKAIRSPYGIILITGPTGSGKTTTLYAFLQVLNKEERNIITLEDPVEYYIEGVNQSQIKPEIGYTFAGGLRSILRQDPNIIMVGEVRDNETAELAVHAALTGHLVFSTLHTNDSIGAIPRLADMGVEPFLISASLNAVVAQRLVRRICPDCKEEIDLPLAIREKIKKELEEIPAEEIKKYNLSLRDGIKFYRGKGCEACGNLGLKGRVAIYEVFELDPQVREMIAEGKGEETNIRKESARQKMVTMRQDGLLKVVQGTTTFSEVERVTEGSLSVGGEVEDDEG
jgi:type IV pilus assembly protein PilB